MNKHPKIDEHSQSFWDEVGSDLAGVEDDTPKPTPEPTLETVPRSLYENTLEELKQHKTEYDLLKEERDALISLYETILKPYFALNLKLLESSDLSDKPQEDDE